MGMERYQFNPKVLILVTGVPGSGKRTLVNKLQRSINACIVDSDLIKDLFTSQREGAFYSNDVRPATYKIIDNTIQTNLESGCSILEFLRNEKI